MADTRTIRDPFLDKEVEISDRLVDRLRGKYAVGPTLPNGEPEFGWRQHQTPPIQHEAATEIDRNTELLEAANKIIAEQGAAFAREVGRNARLTEIATRTNNAISELARRGQCPVILRALAVDIRDAITKQSIAS